MSTIIDFFTRDVIPDRYVNFEIVGWKDPDIRHVIDTSGRCLVDGNVPLELAQKMMALCAEYERREDDV